MGKNKKRNHYTVKCLSEVG